MLRIHPEMVIPETEIVETFVRASGPGGQHVNKASTAVQLRFDAASSASLPEPVRHRLLRIAGRLATSDGIIVIQAGRFRSRKRNREDARRRLAELIRRATVAPRKRRPTRPTAAARNRRLSAKRMRARLKQTRRKPDPGQD
ncbi:MAG: aminoacyl-tRNA hydrolase [Desulfobacteraceae bacterium]|nr:aminoacyl-tRNA hydrolase [Desulfobacteraceae bacterium]